MESKNLCASEDLPLGTIQSRSAYSRSKAGCSPSSARNLMATPPRSLSVAPSFSACSVVRRASSTTSDLVLPVLPSSPLILRLPLLSGLLGSPLSPSPLFDMAGLSIVLHLYPSCASLAAVTQGP